ncbi:MAG: hypothetical protein AAF447_01680 [Myxococcota bacterium]
MENASRELRRAPGWTVDARSWPLLQLELRDPLRDDIPAYGAALAAVCAAHSGRFATVTRLDFDPRNSPAEARRAFAEKVDEAFQGRALAEAVVSPTPLLRGIVTAHGWLRRSPAPLRAFRDAASARRWALAALGEEGLLSGRGER